MSPSRSKTILGVVSLASLILSSLSIFGIPRDVLLDSSSRFAASVTFTFNIGILFAWLSFGALGGVIAGIFSSMIVLWINLRAGLYGYDMLIFLFQVFITSIAAHTIIKLRFGLENSYSLKLEKLDEEANVLANEINVNKTEVKSIESRLERYSNLKDMAESMSTVLSLDDMNRLIMEKTQSAIGKPGRTLLFLVDPARQELMLTVSSQASGAKAKKGDIFDKWVLRHRKSLIVEDMTNDFRFPADKLEESKNIFRSLIEVPMITENKVVGILRMDNMQELAYTQDDLRLLDIIANLGALAIQNAMLYSRTQELATKDSLTGLTVRRYFMDRFREEIKRAEINKGHLSFILLDIDRFKDYNDKYGHAAGDIVLKHLARMISAAVEGTGIVVRYGGEEMAVLLCEKNKNQAVSMAEKIRKMIRDNPLTLRRHDTKITVSIGLSSYPTDALTEEQLMKIADTRLYRAKHEGRDRVVYE